MKINYQIREIANDIDSANLNIYISCQFVIDLWYVFQNQTKLQQRKNKRYQSL